MLRLKAPIGEIPPLLYKELDNMSDAYGQGIYLLVYSHVIHSRTYFLNLSR